MRRIAAILLVLIVAVGAAWLWFAPRSKEARFVSPLVAPIGVTLQPARTGTFYADSRGMTLYVFDNDKQPSVSTCLNDCAQNWPPLSAPETAKPFADWSILSREGGGRQWALAGKPLYTSIKDKQVADASANGADPLWHAVMLRPGEGMALPYGMGVQETAQGEGLVLVDSAGEALYAFGGDIAEDRLRCVPGSCAGVFSPFQAPEMANPVGDLTIVARRDAGRQWAYKGRPLYRYSGDVESGDANGGSVDGRFQLALIAHFFMPADVEILPDERFGGILATKTGQTLYIRDRFRRTVGGHNTRAGARGVPADGRMVGLSGCDAECEQLWHPFLAPADVVPASYWSVVDRPDGKKQWVYRGYPLYTYAQDRAPGDMTGHDLFDYGISVAANAVAGGAPALYWHIAVP